MDKLMGDELRLRDQFNYSETEEDLFVSLGDAVAGEREEDDRALRPPR